ncbi:hypothetical protein BK703_31080 [Bacillus thuringiensis serovar silo]|uniref:hypothetical protein n=1 Tax=Bacillus thuringiensis TaxID=1428 RepID=UPI000A368D6C|nr:hypothetical protein [Bacillus thuringiensis]OTW47560.1 hypothetical protein BK703_31080 [Bacillus thuringiensis serovar silo]OTW60656.1 hypothetical protein BK700_23475 [Bacillus thuringiensis serovar toguchini]
MKKKELTGLNEQLNKIYASILFFTISIIATTLMVYLIEKTLILPSWSIVVSYAVPWILLLIQILLIIRVVKIKRKMKGV